MKLKTFILTFLMMSCSIVFGQGTMTGNASNENWLKARLADSDYGTIILANDIELTTGNIVIPNGRTVTIDLNGHTLSTTDNSTYIINNLGKLTIKDSNESGNGKISAYGGIYNGKTYNPNVRTAFGDVNLNAKLTIESGVIEDISSDKRAVIYNYGMLYITGGKFYGKYSGITNYGMADIKNTYIECLGADNDVAAIVNDFDITFGENVYIAGEYRAVTGTAAYTGTPIFLYAELNGNKYSSLQDAIDNAIDGDVVTLIANGTEDEVLITQKADVDVTINGNNKTFTGHITIFGSGRHTGAETLTIQNVVFQAVDGKGECIASATKINGVNSYAHNVTVEGCTFKGNDTYSADNTFAIRFPSGGVGYDLTVTGCTADDKMFGLLWVTQVGGELIVDNCTAEGVKEGIVLTNTTTATITNTTIDASNVAIRAGQTGAADGTINAFTFNNNILKSDDIAIQIRGNATDANLSMKKNVVSGTTHISGNTAATNIAADENYWDGKEAPVVAEGSAPIVVNSYYSDEARTNLVRNEMGSIYAFVSSDRIFGDVTTNAKESIKIEIIGKDGHLIGTSSLEDLSLATGFNKQLTWRINLGDDDSDSWAMTWNGGAPSINNMPAKVKLYVDAKEGDAAVAESEIRYTANGDGTSPVFAAKTTAEGKINSFIACTGEFNLSNAANKLVSASADGDNIAILVAGTYAVPTGKNLTITGAVDGVVFDNIGATNMGGANVTFNNVTFDYYPNVNYTGLQHSGNLVYNNCTFEGQPFLYGTSETFNNCTFNQNSADAYNVWTYGAKEVAFNGCTFNSAGKSVLIYSEQSDLVNNVTVTDCDFIASAPVEGKAAIEMNSELTAGINLTIDAATTANGFGSGNVSGNSLWNNKMGNNNDANNDITVVVDGETVLEPIYVAKIGEEGHRTLQEAIGKAVAGDNTIQLLADITGDVTITQKEGVNIVINGNKAENENYTFTGVMTVFGDARHDGNETLTIKDINFVAKNGSDACILSPDRTAQNPARYSYSHNVTVDNCTFTDPDGNVNCAAIRHNDGGDVNWTLNKCTVDNTMHSLIQTNNVKGQLVIAECTVNSKNGINLNSCTNVEMTGCNFEVQGYALRSGVNTGGNLGEEKQFVLNNNILKSACDDGDAVIMFRASSVDANLSMTKNVVKGTTHISGNTTDTNIDADANYWGEGLTGPVVAGTNVDVNSYYADEAREQLIVTALTLQQFVEKVTEGNGTYNGTFTEGGVEKNITVKVAPVSGDARSTNDVRVPNRLQKYTNPEVYYAQYQRFSELTNVNISNVNFVFYPAAVTVTDAWNTPGATTTADNINGELQLLNTGSVSFANCSFEKMSVSPINAATLSVTSSKFNGLDAYAIKDIKATTATITGTTFTDCNGGFWFNNAPTTLTVTDNTFTGTGRRGAIQFSANGDYANTEMTVTGNEVTDEAAFLWQLNNTISNAQLNAILDKNNNTYETAFVEGSVKLHLQGEGTADNPYLINDISDLEFFRDHVNEGNTYAGKYIKVTATEIDLNNEEWTPIAYMGKTFKGNFDGNNVTVKNLKITKALTNSAENNGIGFFGSTGAESPATIENIIIENVDITGSLYVGAIVGYGYTGKHVKGCTVKGDITIDAWWYAGVIGGNGYMNLIDNCHVIGNDGSYIKGNDGSYIGGIWGFRGEGNNKITNCTVENLDIIGVDRVGGICGIGHYGNTISGCDAEDVTVTATDPEATTIGLLVGATQGNVNGPTIFEDNDASGITAQIDNGDGTYTEVTNLYGTNIDGGVAVTNYVAQIVGGTQYPTLAEAVAAAVNNDVITLLPTNAPIAMNAALYGKNVTITGDATVDWSKGFLFVGRGGAGNAILTFDNANLTSASDNASTGIHVSGREKGTNDKYDGTLVINNSTIELDYLINKGTMTLDNSTLTVKNGFSVGGRPASETESGQDATATITLNNNSKVVVNNHNGMGLGYEAIGVMYINSGSTFETTQSFLITAKGTMNVNGGNVKTVGTLTNNGAVNVTGESILDIETLTENEIDFLDGAIIKNSTVGGGVFVAGKVTFRGDNTFAMLYDYGTLTGYYGTTANMEWTVEEGASLTLTDKARYGLGYGDNVTINGSITDALEARENLTEDDRSLFMHGLVAQESSGWNCNSKLTVKNAYVVLGSNNSFGNKPGNYGGNYTFNFNNSVVDGSRITFYEALSTTEFTFEDSDVKIGTFMTRDTDSKFTLKDSKVLSTTTTNGTDEGNYNAGELVLENSSLTYSAAVINTGTIEIGAASTLTAPAVTNEGTINFTALDSKLVTVTEGLTIKLDEAYPDHKVVYKDRAYVVVEKVYVAKIGEQGYESLAEALEAVEDDETITLTGVEGSESGEIEFNRAIEFTITGTAQNYALPVVTFQNATVNIKDATILIPELDARQNATINVINSTVNDCGGNSIVKSYYDGAINIDAESTVYTMQVTTMGYITVAGTLNATWQTNVYGNGLITLNEGATFNTAALQLTAKDYSGRDNTDADRVGQPAEIVVNGATLNVGKVQSSNGADYSYHSSYGINVGTIEGKSAILNIINGGTVNYFMKDGETANIGAGGTVNVNASTFNVACRAENGTVTLANAGTINVENATVEIAKLDNDNLLFISGENTFKVEDATGSSYALRAKDGVVFNNSYVKGTANETIRLLGSATFNGGFECAYLQGQKVIEDNPLNGGIGGTIAIEEGTTVHATYGVEISNDYTLNGGNIELSGGNADGDLWGFVFQNSECTINSNIKVVGNTGTYAPIHFTNVTATVNGNISQSNSGGEVIYIKNSEVTFAENSNVTTTTGVHVNDGSTLTNRGEINGNVTVNSTLLSENNITGAIVKAETATIQLTGGIYTTEPQDGWCADNYGAFPYDENSWVVREIYGEQTIALQAGWNWVSSYITKFEGEDGLDMLQNSLGTNGIQIKNDKLSSAYNNNEWGGRLNEVSVNEMYKVKVNATFDISFEGSFVNYDEKEIILYQGWNYIGYPVNVKTNLADALVIFDEYKEAIEANANDVIKSQHGTAYCLGTNWVFSNQFNLVPGEGYMYYNSSDEVKVLRYTTKEATTTSETNTRSSNHWTVDATQYPSNMTMIAMTDVEGGNYEVAAFVNGEVRGSSRPIYVEELDAYILILTISGDDVEEMTFKCYDLTTGEEVEFSNRINYSNDAIVGSADEPYMLTRGTIGIGEAAMSNVNIYPNPTTTGTEINLEATCDKVEVFNALGVKVVEYQNVDSIDALETAGIYVIRITNNGNVQNCRLLVK